MKMQKMIANGFNKHFTKEIAKNDSSAYAKVGLVKKTSKNDSIQPTMAMTTSANIRQDNWSVLLCKVGSEHNQQAFSQLFDHFAPLLKGFCQANTSFPLSAEVAEEITQEVMCKVWLKAKNYDPSKAAANTWIFTVMRNTRIDYLRKNSKHNVTDNDLDADDIWDEELDHQPFVYLQKSRDQDHIKDMLAIIPEEQAMCLKKVYIEGKSHSEISAELSLPLGTVKSRVRLGLKRIQAKFVK